MRDFFLKKICDIENWQALAGRNVWNWPLTVLSFILLITLLLISNLFAIIGWCINVVTIQKKSLDDAIIEINDNEGLDNIIENHDNVVVDFWASWCGPCMMMKPALKQIAKEYNEHVVVAMVDTTISSRLAKQYSIKGLPTLLFFKDGKLLEQHAGALSKEHLAQKINQQFQIG